MYKLPRRSSGETCKVDAYACIVWSHCFSTFGENRYTVILWVTAVGKWEVDSRLNSRLMHARAQEASAGHALGNTETLSYVESLRLLVRPGQTEAE